MSEALLLRRIEELSILIGQIKTLATCSSDPFLRVNINNLINDHYQNLPSHVVKPKEPWYENSTNPHTIQYKQKMKTLNRLNTEFGIAVNEALADWQK